MLLIVTGRPMSRVPPPLGVIEEIYEWKEGNLTVGLRFLVNRPTSFGMVLPRFFADRLGLLQWYPLGDRYFPVEGLKPSLDEIIYDFREGLDSTSVLFEGDIYGNLNSTAISKCEYKLRELELYSQALADKLLSLREDVLRLIKDVHEEDEKRLKPLVKWLKEINSITGSSSSSKESTTKLKKRLEELEKKLESGTGEEEVDEEELGAIDRALQRLGIGR